MDRLFPDAEIGRCPRCQISIRIYRTRLARLDYDFGGLEGSHIIPFALRALAQAWQQGQQSPPVINLKTVEIQAPIIGGSGFFDRHSSTIVPAIANRYLHRPDFFH